MCEYFIVCNWSLERKSELNGQVSNVMTFREPQLHLKLAFAWKNEASCFCSFRDFAVKSSTNFFEVREKKDSPSWLNKPQTTSGHSVVVSSVKICIKNLNKTIGSGDKFYKLNEQ